MAKNLEGKVAVVTGSGMGAAKGIAVGLAREGAKVVTNNRKPGSVGMSSWLDQEQTESLLTEEDKQLIASLGCDAQTTADQIVQEGGEAIPFFGDPGDFDTAGELVQAAMDEWGRIDILVNGAAGAGFGPFMKLSKEDWHYQTHAKLNGTFHMMHHSLPIMTRQKFGRVLNAASDAWVGLPMLAAYSAACAAVVGLTKAVAREVWGTGVTCNVFCPLAISRNHVNWRASMRQTMAKMDPTQREALQQQIDEMGKQHQAPEKLAPFLAYLSTEEASHVSGSVFTVSSAGGIRLYSEFSEEEKIEKAGDAWTVDELMTAVPERLLKDYVSIAAAGTELGSKTSVSGQPAS